MLAREGSLPPAVVSCNRRTLKLRKAGFLVYGNANDVTIVTRGNFLSILKECTDDVLEIIQNWCRNKGLINPTKTTAMIFTRKYKSAKPIEPLKL